MKNGVYGTVAKLKNELTRQRAARQDLVADTRSLSVETVNGKMVLTVHAGEQEFNYDVNDLAHRQIADKLKIPYGYYQRMQNEVPSLLDNNVNTWFKQNPKAQMLRILDGNVRAFLSARYRRLDNLELLDAVLPEIEKMRGAVIESMDVTETHLYIKVVNKNMKKEIGVGDVVYSGFVISNSEVGLGAINVSPMLYRKVCSNGLILNEFAGRKYHAGKAVENTESAYEFYSDTTMALDDATYFSKVKDIIKATADDIAFEKIVQKVRASQRIKISDPIKAVDVLKDRFVLSQQEQANLMMHFLKDGDYTLYGLTNAITRTSQDVADYDRATELERMGGVFLSEGLANQDKSNKTYMSELLAA